MLPLIILAGPTTSRKSEIAVALAEKLNGEIINADSLQVYKYFDIGTAKPAKELRKRVVHHLIDILEPEEDFNAFDFKVRALQIIDDINKRNRVPILAGGTGLYLKVLTEDYNCAVEISADVRKQVQAEIKTRGPQILHAELHGIDPESAARIKPTDPVRIERALSVYRQTGRPLSEFHNTDTNDGPGFPIVTFLLERDRKELYENIDQRVDGMMKNGLVEEILSLIDRGYSTDLKPFKSIGYAQIVRHLKEGLPLDQAIHEIKRETRHYAKRQITWFKKIPNALPVPANSTDTPETLRDRILSLLPRAASVLLMLLLVAGGFSPVRAEDKSSFEQAVDFFKRSDYNQAEVLLNNLRQTDPDSPQGKRIRYLLALTQGAKNEPAHVIETLQPLLKEYTEIQDYIRLELARAYVHTDQPGLAAEQIDRLFRKTPQTLLWPQARLLQSEILRKQGNLEEAKQILERAAELITVEPSERRFRPLLPEMLFKQAELQEQLGHPEQAYLQFQNLFIRYPTHPLTEKAVRNMDRLKPQVTERPLTLEDHSRRLRALMNEVRYQEVIEAMDSIKRNFDVLPGRFYFFQSRAHLGLRQRDLANKVLREFIRRYPYHARVQEAQFTIARNLWNMGQNRKGIAMFEQVIEGSPSSAWASKAHFFIGRMHEEKKRYSAAADRFAKLVKLFGDDEYAQWGMWRIGWVHYLSGDFAVAYQKFQEGARLYPKGMFIEYNLYWTAKAAEQLKKHNEALELYKIISQLYPFTYYGVRAGEQLASRGITTSNPTSSTSTSREPDLGVSLTPGLGRDLSPDEQFHHIRAIELTEMRFQEEAKNEIRHLERSIRKNLSGVMWLAHLYNQAEAYSDTLRLLQLYKDFMTKQREKDLSKEFWVNFYPLAYSDIIEARSKKHNVDPLFVKGLIRQESLFDSQSLSRAGARGLMQIMPETGKQLYSPDKTGEPFDTEFLFDPEFNIQLGIKYISQLNKRFGKNGTHILISYNAGPHVLKKWLKRFRNLEDRDVFVESIPYPETRRYVKHVMRNYGIYRMLYQKSRTEK